MRRRINRRRLAAATTHIRHHAVRPILRAVVPCGVLVPSQFLPPGTSVPGAVIVDLRGLTALTDEGMASLTAAVRILREQDIDVFIEAPLDPTLRVLWHTSVLAQSCPAAAPRLFEHATAYHVLADPVAPPRAQEEML